MKLPLTIVVFLSAAVVWEVATGNGYLGSGERPLGLIVLGSIVATNAYVVLWIVVPREDVARSPAGRFTERISPRRVTSRYPKHRVDPGRRPARDRRRDPRRPARHLRAGPVPRRRTPRAGPVALPARPSGSLADGDRGTNGGGWRVGRRRLHPVGGTGAGDPAAARAFAERLAEREGAAG